MDETMAKKLRKAREDINERRKKKKVYVKEWRVHERVRRRKNHFVASYVKHKFFNDYSEAICLYDALEKKYPQKRDLCKTEEFLNWKESVSCKEELAGTVQILITETTLNEGYQDGVTRCISETVLNGERESVSDQDDTDSGEKYNDNMVLEIPLETYSPRQPAVDETPTVAAYEIAIPAVDEIQPTDEITNERIREIIEELQNDPDLNGLFNDQQPVRDDVFEDEGVGIASLEDEIMMDFEPFDFEAEVEQGNW